MHKIGITGGIGSGKTTICQFFELLGVPVFYADKAAKEVMQLDEILIDDIKSSFGASSYFEDGTLNRKYLASKVFSSEDQLALLNSLVHPAVFRAFDYWVNEQRSRYVVKEAALLFESKSYLDCNFTILVTAPVELRIKRVMKRDAITELEILDRISRQWADSEKEKLADLTLINDDTHFLIPQILKLHQRFLHESTI